MYTHCPHCETYFRVTSEQLKSAQGDVRCGRCFGTFNALENLVDEPPKSKAPSTPPPPTLEEKPNGEIPTGTPSNGSTGPEDNLKRAHSQQLIDELQSESAKAASGKKRLAWFLLSLPLAALLGVQYLYFNVDSLSQDPQMRPAVITLCKFLNCEVPLQRAPKLIKMSDRDIRAHATKKEVLVVRAVLVNSADFVQPFPMVQLTMQDITGHVMSGRRFLPDEYLRDPAVNIVKGIQPNQAYAIELELVDPGKEAVGFEFEFL